MHIFTDGSCLGNPGRGGWGVIIYNNHVETNELFRLSGNDLMTTNNIMELTAMDQALDNVLNILDTDHVLNVLNINNDIFHIHTDSNYVKLGMTEWIKKWKRNGFKTAVGKDVKNFQLWIQIDRKMGLLGDRVSIHWVKAHNGNQRNQAVDHLAREQAESVKS
jgi:ribonuclease HI